MNGTTSDAVGRYRMTVKALYEYDYPSRDRQENFGDDLLVNVQWLNNPMFGCSGLLPGAQGDARTDSRPS